MKKILQEVTYGIVVYFVRTMTVIGPYDLIQKCCEKKMYVLLKQKHKEQTTHIK